MGTVWDDETIFRLIEVFETKRILWDCATWSKDYKNKIKKNVAWEEISKTLEISKLDVESKMHTLRSQFARERKKILSLQTTGIADNEISKWKFYDALKFLSSGAQRSGSLVDRADTVIKAANPNDLLEIELIDTSMASSRSTPEPQTSVQIAPSSYRTNKRKNDDSFSETCDIVKSAKRKMDDTKDEFDIYGQYVASELRETRDEYSALIAKSLINNILIDMRMGKYKNHT